MQSTLTFISGSVNGTWTLAIPSTQYLGPQSINYDIITNLIIFHTNPCHPAHINISLVQDNAVLLPGPPSCSYEVQYGNLVAAGVTAILIQMTQRPPGVMYNAHDGVAPASSVVLAEVRLSTDLERRLRTESQPVRIRLRPVPNPWASTLRLWTYQLLLRWLPTILFAVSAAASFIFTAANVRRRRPAALSIVHVALLIRMVSSGVLAVKFALVGTLSTPVLTSPLQLFLLPQLTGVTFITIMITSTVWNRIRLGIVQLPPRPVSGNIGLCNAAAYGVVLAGDLTISLSLAMHKSQVLAPQISAAFYGVCLAFAGPQLIFSSWRLGRVSRGVHGSLMLYLDRMRRIVASLGIMITLYVVGFLMYAVDGAVTPTSWILIWSWLSICHGIIAILQVWLFHPALISSQNLTPTPPTEQSHFITVHPRSITADKSSITQIVEHHRRASSFTPIHSIMVGSQ